MNVILAELNKDGGSSLGVVKIAQCVVAAVAVAMLMLLLADVVVVCVCS